MILNDLSSRRKLFRLVSFPMLKDSLSHSKNERVRKLSAPFALYLYYINSDRGDRTCLRDLFSLCPLWVATKSGKPGLDMFRDGLNCRKNMYDRSRWSVEGALGFYYIAAFSATLKK